MSTEHIEGTLPSAHMGLQLFPYPENCYPSMSWSPDSNSSISNVSDREASRSSDRNALDCVNERSPLDNYYNANSAATNTFNVSPVNSTNGAGLLSQMSLSGASHREYTADDCCFLSSGEMVMRGNSFFLDDQSPIVVSSLDKSCNYPPECPAVRAEFSLQAITERDTDENTGRSCLGMTEENDIATSPSRIALPSENEKGLLMTFTICERSAQCEKEPMVTSAETELLPYFSERVTPELDMTFVFTPSVMQNRVNNSNNNNNQTSTPVPVTGKKISRLLSFSESPGIGSANRPGLDPVTQKQMSVTREQCLVARQPPSAGKDDTMEVKKSDFCNVKPKLVTRSRRHVAVPGSQHKKQANVNNKCTVSRRETTITVGSPNTSGSAAVDGHCPAVSGHISSSSEHAVSSQAPGSSVQNAGCLPSFKKSFKVKGGQMDSKPTPKNGVSNKIYIKSSSALDQLRSSARTTQPQRSAESCSLTSRLPKKKRTTSASGAIQKSDTLKGHTKPGNLKGSSQNKRAVQAEETNSCTPPTEVRKPSLCAWSSKLTTAGVSRDDYKSRFQRRTLGTTPCSQSPAASSRSCIVRQQQGRSSMSKAERSAHSQQPTSASIQRTEALHRPAPSASIKPQLRGSRLPQTPARPSLIGSPRKILGLSKCLTNSSPLTGKTPVSGAAVHKPTQLKSIGLKARLISRNNTGPSLTTACTSAATTGKGASGSKVSPLKKTVSTRHGQPSSVDKNKSKFSSHQQHSQQRASQPNQRNGPLDVGPVTEGEKKDQSIQTECYSNYDAVSIILQKALAEFDDAKKKCRRPSQELNDLHGELVFSVSSSECLEKEKELHELLQAKWDESKALMQQQMNELQASHEAMKLELEGQHEQLQYVKQQHEVSLEELMKTKKDAVALSEQIQDLTAKNNALIEKLTAEENRRDELAEKTEDDSHSLYLEQELESLKAVLDIKNKQLHEQEKKLMETGQLTEKNITCDESLKKVQQENNDSHSLYLEQELESVKVVLDMKNKQLHQLEKRLMEMGQLAEKNAMLDETLKKAQQENENLKACMERQAALSRQLSTEQAALQKYLHKESQLNKRLSMENEELLWKLNNGDLSSPLKMSPTSNSFTLQSPHSSDPSSSSDLSPR
ncbi:microtubule-associated tumor suppressor 1 homolog A [Parambassis ranga]|uniref:Microtubule-associated tumor suppressor 1 homolog n=1 Tax=Parambassis ranga TaxID=210632 RepID=A0A6P7J553_9TELE|nr:microtubule-associated tumor suppressor 1 homolog [Parambassis ranga]XP_028271590.1 microtubule-associated tumor suppressor 1 homolog [Parambassis ranga]XP_028271591.1 microtubule-associated tumor suppressor 1 homolog [Parambassis ranga]XP_028271592.1 microtubule-associated tumor suppressor 1 homolog [Parambassis ranga]XP_028271594.1 microtubule-associated tumor suppressor 1 homolog [Parambassis ranga]